MKKIKHLVLRLKPYQVMIVGFSYFRTFGLMHLKISCQRAFCRINEKFNEYFLNALTFEDKNLYPISSRNNQDFMNLTKVYLDAVFNPLILNKKKSFTRRMAY
ncbi:MAG: hypothetical protein ACLR43_03980 [Faecalibacillus faecis]